MHSLRLYDIPKYISFFCLTDLKTGLNPDNDSKVVSCFGYSSSLNTTVLRRDLISTGVISLTKIPLVWALAARFWDSRA